MKILLSIILFVLTTCAPSFAANVPIKLKGEKSAGVSDVVTIEVPESQVTQTATTRGRIESGNQNLLINPSFEHMTPTTAWTAVGATISGTTAQYIDGNKSLLVTGTGTVYQGVTTPSSWQGTQGYAEIYVNSATTASVGVWVDGTLQVTIPVPPASKWGSAYQLPFVMGASTASVGIIKPLAGNIYLDKATLQVAGKLTSPSGAPTQSYHLQQAGNSLTNRNAEVEFNLSSATIRNIGTPLIVAVDDSSNTRTKFIASQNCSVTISWTYEPDATGAANMIFKNGTAYTTMNAPTSTYITNGSITISLNAGEFFSVGSNGNVVSDSEIAHMSFLAVGTAGNIANYSAMNADTEWAPCTFSTMAWTGLGTVTNTSLQCRRSGGDLEMRGKLTLGTTSGSTAEFLLPNNFGPITVGVTDNSSCGNFLREQALTSVIHNVICASGANYVWTSGAMAVGSNPGAAGTGGNYAASDVIEYSNVRIPIAGWYNQAQIYGNFTEGVKTLGVASPEFMSFSYGTTNSTTVCSANPCSYFDSIGSGGLTGLDRSGTGNYNIKFAKTYTKIKCQIMATRSAFELGSASCANCNTLAFVTENNSGTAIDTYGNVFCHAINN